MPLLGSSNDLTINISAQADTAGVTQTEEQLSNLSGQVEDTDEKTGGFASTMGNLADQIRTVGTYIAGYQIIQFFRSFADEAFGGAGNLEQVNIAFQGMIGNVKQANSVFAQLVQYANVTPFQMADIEAAARTLMSFGTGGQQTVNLIKQIGDVSAASGGNIGDLAQVVGEVFSQGTFDARNLLELVHDGGGALVKIMADSAGGMVKLRAEMQKGKVTSQDFFDALNKATSNGGFAFQATDHEAQTLNGRISTLKDAVQQFAMKLIGVKIDPQLGLVIEKGGLFDKAKGIIENLTKALEKLGDSKAAVMAIAGALGGVLLGTLIAIGVAIGAVPIAIVAVTAGVGAFISFAINGWNRWKVEIIAGTVLLGGLIGVVVLVAALIIKNWQSIVNFFKTAWGTIKTDAGKALDWLKNNWASALGYMIGFVATFPIKLPLYIIEAFVKIISYLGSLNWGHIFGNILTAIGDVKTGIWNAIKWAFDKVTGLDWGKIVVNVGNGIANAIIDLINSAIKGAFSGVPVLKDHIPEIPHFASGITNFGGGWAIVGENGPELAYLPTGSGVYTASQSQSMGRQKPMGKSVTVNQTNHFYTQYDPTIAAQELGFRLAHA